MPVIRRAALLTLLSLALVGSAPAIATATNSFEVSTTFPQAGHVYPTLAAGQPMRFAFSSTDLPNGEHAWWAGMVVFVTRHYALNQFGGVPEPDVEEQPAGLKETDPSSPDWSGLVRGPWNKPGHYFFSYGSNASEHLDDGDHPEACPDQPPGYTGNCWWQSPIYTFDLVGPLTLRAPRRASAPHPPYLRAQCWQPCTMTITATLRALGKSDELPQRQLLAVAQSDYYVDLSLNKRARALARLAATRRHPAVLVVSVLARDTSGATYTRHARIALD